MAEDTDAAGGAEEMTEPAVVKTTIPADPSAAEYAFLEVVADLEGVEIDALPSLYERLDHLVELLFENPPAREAQIELAFSYSGYRVQLTQGGQLTMLDVEGSVEDR